MNTDDYKSTLHEYFNEDYSPKKCPNCKSTEFVETVKEQIEGIVCEYYITCKDCGTDLGYWAYGGFDPNFWREV